MTNDLTPHEPNPTTTGSAVRSLRSLIERHITRNGMIRSTGSTATVAAPSPLLVVAINEVLQTLANGNAGVISDKPLPDPEELNAAIPINEWEIGIDGKPRKPWEHIVVVYSRQPRHRRILHLRGADHRRAHRL